MSEQEKTGGLAFPHKEPIVTQSKLGMNYVFSHKHHQGMTLLDYFAGQAMQAIIAKSPSLSNTDDLNGTTVVDDSQLLRERKAIANGAYHCAAAMLAEKRRREADSED